MSRYVLRFNKKGYMRFISHLDLQNLFRRALYRAQVPLAFTNGFNPHPVTNIVQPLSLGFEADCDYFEFETKMPMDAEKLPEMLNPALPEGIQFIDAKEIPHEKKNLSAFSEFSGFTVFVPIKTVTEDMVTSFLAQEKVCVLKRDKKTKTYVEKDIKNWIYSFDAPKEREDGSIFTMVLRAAPNETVNPQQLMESFMKFCSIDLPSEEIRVTRTDLYFTVDGNLESLYARKAPEKQN